MHTHNVLMDEVQKDYRFGQDYRPTAVKPPRDRATFNGYLCVDGRVGTRNYIGIFITVNCAATVARSIAVYFDEERLTDYPNIDGVIPFIYAQGCGMEQTGEPIDLLRRTLKGYVQHGQYRGCVDLRAGVRTQQPGSLLSGHRARNRDDAAANPDADRGRHPRGD